MKFISHSIATIGANISRESVEIVIDKFSAVFSVGSKVFRSEGANSPEREGAPQQTILQIFRRAAWNRENFDQWEGCP